MSNKLAESIGKVFGRLTIIKDAGRIYSPNGVPYILVECRCACGNSTIKRLSSIRGGNTSSCGCLALEHRKSLGKNNTTHGQTKNRTASRTYKSWISMKERCLNPNAPNFTHYGGRGITVCNEWLVYEAFLNSMGERPINTSLDRVDNDKNYCQENCKWSTPKEQSNNRQCTSMVMFKGENLPLNTVASMLGFKRNTLYHRIFEAGWSVEDALATPISMKNAGRRRKPVIGAV